MIKPQLLFFITQFESEGYIPYTLIGYTHIIVPSRIFTFSQTFRRTKERLMNKDKETRKGMIRLLLSFL